MSAEWSLRHRLSVSLAIFSGLVSLLLATIIYIASHDLEERLIDDTLTAELDDYVARRHRNPLSLPEQTTTIRAYVVAERGGTAHVPVEVSRLQPGKHEISLDGVIYRAVVRDVDAQRFVVLYNTTTLRQREKGFLLLLSVSVVMVTLFAALTGRWLAVRVIAPVDELARRVSELQPEDEPIPLAEEFPWIEVRRLAEDFDVYLARLHDFIERERLFTGDVSHELRTPLAVITGATDLMLSDETMTEKNLKRVNRIARSVHEMGDITSTLLALSREQDDSHIRSSECDVQQVTQDIIERYREIFKHQSTTISLKVDGPLVIMADQAILSMVLGNLLRNALSYTSEGEVLVHIDSQSVSIEDNGPGLGTDHPEELFQPYVRGHHDSSGAGLGLSLVWRLCKRIGWKIELKNRPRGGTLARVWLKSSG